MYTSDREGDAAQQCPVSFHGEFWYSVYDGVRTTCGSMNERWTVGADLNTMTFNYSLCSTVVANSGMNDSEQSHALSSNPRKRNTSYERT